MLPRLYCARACPRSAANRYNRTASSGVAALLALSKYDTVCRSYTYIPPATRMATRATPAATSPHRGFVRPVLLAGGVVVLETSTGVGVGLTGTGGGGGGADGFCTTGDWMAAPQPPQNFAVATTGWPHWPQYWGSSPSRPVAELGDELSGATGADVGLAGDARRSVATGLMEGASLWLAALSFRRCCQRFT